MNLEITCNKGHKNHIYCRFAVKLYKQGKILNLTEQPALKMRKIADNNSTIYSCTFIWHIRNSKWKFNEK